MNNVKLFIINIALGILVTKVSWYSILFVLFMVYGFNGCPVNVQLLIVITILVISLAVILVEIFKFNKKNAKSIIISVVGLMTGIILTLISKLMINS